MANRPTPATGRITRTALALISSLGLWAPSARADGPPQTQIINEHLSKSWEAAELKPSKKANDYEFCRRIFIDLIGRTPSSHEIRDFAERDKSPNKRSKLIKRLLTEREYKVLALNGAPILGEDKKPITLDYSTEHAQHFANIWTVWLMTRSGLSEIYHEQMQLWLEEQFSKNVPYNEFVTKLLTATGKSDDNGAVNFMIAHMGEMTSRDASKQKEDGKFDMVPITSRVSRLFLGIQTQCTQCHDHPFSPEWKQENFWGLNAFFRQVDRDRTPGLRTEGNKKKMDALPVTLKDDSGLNTSMRIFYERRSGVLMSLKPNFLPNLADVEKETPTSAKKSVTAGSKTRREFLSEYVLAHDNFAKAYVNRLWGHLFGRGLNEQATVDDFGGHNKVVHQEMLDKLAAQFVQYKYDTKSLIEWICNSDAYQLSYQANGLAEGKGGNAKDEAAPYFTRMPLKSMSPEVLFESLMEATKSEAGVNQAEKKAQRKLWMDKLVRNFGDDEGNEMTFNGTIVQALLMMNGRELNSEVNRKGSSTVELAMNRYRNKGSKSGYSEKEILDELYLSALGRRVGTAPVIPLYRMDPKTGKEIVDKTGKPIQIGMTSEIAFLSSQINAIATKSKSPADAGANYKAFFEDVFWSLLNTNEFILNH